MAKKPIAKILYSLHLDRQWLKAGGIPLAERFGYICKKYPALLRGSSSINFLGARSFRYDNRNTPATLQSYPDEIMLLDRWVGFSNSRRVLDIGANIGQFSTTLISLFPSTRIDCFEPNPQVFDLLSANTSGFDNVQVFNRALGPPGSLPFFFVPGASAKGSFIHDNAIINLGESAKADTINVDLVTLDAATIGDLGLSSAYDLVKIDVEGFEYEVLEAMPGISTRYLYVEFSSGRDHPYTFPQLLDRIRDLMGDVDILYCDKIDTSDPSRTIGSLLVGRTGESDSG